MWNDFNIDYSCSLLGEKGIQVESGFEYNSENNHHFLSVKEIKAINNMLSINEY